MGNIKGITIELNGDTTGLDKALSNVNTTIKNTQSELKEVDKLLKLDPANTELLSQKQADLATKIGATKEKLDILKTAQEQAKQQMENGELGADKYDALQREIIATQQELEKLATQAAEANTALNKIGEVGDTLSAVGEKITGVGNSLTTHVTAPIAAVGTAAVAAFTEVDKAEDTVIAKTGATGETLDGLSAAMKNIAETIPTSFETAAEAVGEVNTRFGLTGDACEELATHFVEFARLNNTDVSSSIDTIQNALSAFNMDSSQATTLLDVLNRTGQTTGASVDSMARSLVENASALQQMGLDAYQATAFLGQLETAGADSNSVISGMKRALKEATEAGVPFDQALAELEDTIVNGTDDMDGLTAAYDLFGKSGAGIYQAVRNGQISFTDFADSVDILNSSMDSVSNTFNATLSPTDQATTAMNKLKDTGAQLGDTLLTMLVPVFEKVQEALDKLKSWWENLDESQQKNIITIAGLVAALGPALVIFGKLTSAVGGALTSIKNIGTGVLAFVNQAQAGVGVGGKLAAMFGSISAPVVIAVAAIGTLVAAFVHLWNTNEDFRSKVTEIWEQLKAKFQELFDKLQEVFGKIKDAFSGAENEFTAAVEVLKQIWEGLCNFLAPIFEGVWAQISNILSTAIDVIIGIIDFFTALFQGDWEGCWTAVQDVFSSVWDGIKEYFQIAIDTLIGIADVILGWFGADWETAWNSVSTFFSDIWDGIVQFFTGIWTSINTTVSTATSAVSETITSAWNAVSGFFSRIWTSITTTLSTAWENIKNVVKVGLLFIEELVSAAFQLITLPFRLIWENCHETVEKLWSKIKEVISSALDTIKSVIESVWNAIKAFLTPIVNGIRDTVTNAWNTLKTNVSNAVDAVKSKVDQVWTAIKTSVTTVVNSIRDTVTTAWDTLKSNVSATVDAVKTKVDQVWSAIKTSVTTVAGNIRDSVTTAWNTLKTNVSTAVDNTKQKVTEVWNNIKSTLEPIVDGIKEKVTTAWNTAKENVTTAVNGIKSVAETVWNAIKTAVTTVVDTIKNTISSRFNEAQSVVTTVFNAIKSAIEGPITTAKNTVVSMIDRIKSAFNFTWSLPSLKLPHVSITGSFSLDPPSVPHFSIEWYKKAMEDGIVMNVPTIFGFDGENLLGGGEAGSETIVGTKNLLDMIQQAVASATAAMSGIAAGQTYNNYGNTYGDSNVTSTINVYATEGMDTRELARQVSDLIKGQVRRETAVWA